MHIDLSLHGFSPEDGDQGNLPSQRRQRVGRPFANRMHERNDAQNVVLTDTLPAGSTRVLAQTVPYDHCNMTVIDTAPSDLVDRFAALLASMSYADPRVRPLLDLEGLTAWVDGRDTGYAALETAVEETGFYDPSGAVTAEEYAP